MSVLHVVSSQALNQIEHNGHVGDLFSKSLPSLNESHLLIDTLDLIREAFVLLNENISLYLSPEFSFPVIVLQVCQGNKIPKGF